MSALARVCYFHQKASLQADTPYDFNIGLRIIIVSHYTKKNRTFQTLLNFFFMASTYLKLKKMKRKCENPSLIPRDI